tara:strand:- start:19002 stop:19640 length:639 start_codon:yes stop_codon:yes gene_type:complete
MIITFSGLDGAGKSTYVSELNEKLKEKRLKPKTIHIHQTSLYGCLGKVLEYGNRSLKKRINDIHAIPDQKSLLRKGLSTLLGVARVMLFCLDIIIFRVVCTINSNIFRKLIVCDRYFYDSLVHLHYLGILPLKICKFLKSIILRPTCGFYLKIGADEAYQRKPEHSLRYFKEKEYIYNELIGKDKKVIAVNAKNSIIENIKFIELSLNQKIG